MPSQWTIVPKSLVNRRHFLNSHKTIDDPVIIWKRYVYTMKNIIELTETHDTPEWFELRKF